MFDTIPSGTLIRLTNAREHLASGRSVKLPAGTLGEVLYSLSRGYVCKFDVGDRTPGAGEVWVRAADLATA